ncbi:hypothetical protein Tco_0456343 [Tanacetum coccineum]
MLRSPLLKEHVIKDSNEKGWITRQMQTQESKIDTGPIYDEEPMAEVQLTAECNIFAKGQQHIEQPEIINEAKIEKEFDVLETMNIELEHSVATLRKENETLKQHYKDLYDSIKTTRSKTKEQTTSLLANNAELKALPEFSRKRISKTVGLSDTYRKVIRLYAQASFDYEPPQGSNVDILKFMNANKLWKYVQKMADISETIVKVDSQMMIQKNDVCSQQFRPQSSISNDVCSQQFRPQSSMSNDV